MQANQAPQTSSRPVFDWQPNGHDGWICDNPLISLPLTTLWAKRTYMASGDHWTIEAGNLGEDRTELAKMVLPRGMGADALPILEQAAISFHNIQQAEMEAVEREAAVAEGQRIALEAAAAAEAENELREAQNRMREAAREVADKMHADSLTLIRGFGGDSEWDRQTVLVILRTFETLCETLGIDAPYKSLEEFEEISDALKCAQEALDRQSSDWADAASAFDQIMEIARESNREAEESGEAAEEASQAIDNVEAPY